MLYFGVIFWGKKVVFGPTCWPHLALFILYHVNIYPILGKVRDFLSVVPHFIPGEEDHLCISEIKQNLNYTTDGSTI